MTRFLPKEIAELIKNIRSATTTLEFNIMYNEKDIDEESMKIELEHVWSDLKIINHNV